MFAFHFALLVVPTTLMGLSLPLLARGAVAASREIAPLVGRLYAANTLGAGAGAAVAGWVLLGELGFVATVRLAAVSTSRRPPWSSCRGGWPGRRISGAPGDRSRPLELPPAARRPPRSGPGFSPTA